MYQLKLSQLTYWVTTFFHPVLRKIVCKINISALLCFGFIFISSQVFAANLTITLNEDLPPAVKKNILTHLGELPVDEQTRTAYLFTLNKNIQNAVKALGYYLALIKTDLNKENHNQWLLSINVQLNAPIIIHAVDITIVGEAKNEQEYQKLINQDVIKVGDVLHHGKYEELKSQLLALGNQYGYFDQKLEKAKIAIHQQYTTAKISIIYNSGVRYQFGDINFNEQTIARDLITPLIPFKKGDNYRVELLQTLQNHLEQTQYFGNIVITQGAVQEQKHERIQEQEQEQNQEHENTKSKAPLIPIFASLEKAKSHHVDIGLGFATDTGFNTTFNWRTPLINRHGHQQETKIEYSTVNPSGQFSYTVPLSHPLNDVLKLQLELKNDQFGDIESTYWMSQIGRVRTRNNWIQQSTLRYLQEKWDIDGISDEAEYWLPGISWSHATRKGQLLDPSHGFSQFYTLEGTHTALNAETSFLRFVARWKYVTTLAPKHRLVGKVEAGIAFIDQDNYADLAPSLRFFAGGDQSIRGFSYQSIGPKNTISSGEKLGEERTLGGTHKLTASLEYQYYLNEKWRSALFFDSGSVTNNEHLDPVYAIGTGIHYISPLGAIRLDAGRSISKDEPSWRLHFTFGAEL